MKYIYENKSNYTFRVYISIELKNRVKVIFASLSIH